MNCVMILHMSKVEWSILKQTSKTFYKQDNKKTNSQIPDRLYTEFQIQFTAVQC